MENANNQSANEMKNRLLESVQQINILTRDLEKNYNEERKNGAILLINNLNKDIQNYVTAKIKELINKEKNTTRNLQTIIDLYRASMDIIYKLPETVSNIEAQVSKSQANTSRTQANTLRTQANTSRTQ